MSLMRDVDFRQDVPGLADQLYVNADCFHLAINSIDAYPLVSETDPAEKCIASLAHRTSSKRRSLHLCDRPIDSTYLEPDLLPIEAIDSTQLALNPTHCVVSQFSRMQGHGPVRPEHLE